MLQISGGPRRSAASHQYQSSADSIINTSRFRFLNRHNASVPSGTALSYFIGAFNDSGFSFKHLLVWVKHHFVLGMSDYQHRHEAVLYGWI